MSFRSRFGSGFPFDDNEDRGLRARLAERHPEFAEHLNPDTWGRSRTASGSSNTAGDDPFARFRNRSRFQEFGFPFDDEFEDPCHFGRYYTQQQTPPKPPQPEATQSQGPPPQPQQPSTTPTPSKPPTPPTSADTGKKKIQQSSTVDLGQPQAPLVDETRTHRSMSAPPEHPNRTSSSGKQRYVSSVNIPNVNADKMGGSSSQPQQPASKEHIIPIHIEGRDEVVMPSTAAQQSAPSPQPERIFGQRPGLFTKYVNPQEGAQEDLRHQEDLRRQQQQQKYQEFVRQQQAQQQQQQHQQQQETPPQQQAPAPAKAKPTSLELIQNIQKDVSELMTQVENFDGKPRDKKYLYLDEMLTRKMLQLDDIETGGQDAIRKARKEAIKCIQDTIKVLETKAAANDELKAIEPPQKETTPTPAEAPAEANTEAPATSTIEQPPTGDSPSVAEAPANAAEKEPVDMPTENQELVVGGVVRSGSQVTPMDVDVKKDQPPPVKSSEQPPAETAAPPAADAQPASETNIPAEGGATEKKRVKKKAEKK